MSNDSILPDNGQAGKPTPVPGTSFEDQCSLLALGYRPIPINGKAPRWSGWPAGVSRPSRLEAIRAENPDHENTGILTGDLVMADVDLPHYRLREFSAKFASGPRSLTDIGQRMSAVGGKADVLTTCPESPLLAKSRTQSECQKPAIFQIRLCGTPP